MNNTRLSADLLKATCLSVGYHNRAVLTEVNLEIRCGEFWFFLGPNGSGKSTLVSTFLGLLPPLSGSVTLCDRSQIAFVPQASGVNLRLPTTVQELVWLGLAGLKLTRSEETQRIDWALECVGMSNLRQQSFWNISGGERQRTLVAQALVRKPRLLFLDEPTSGVDAVTKEQLSVELQELNRSERIAVVFVTHELDIALNCATHLGLFSEGRLCTGPVGEIIKPGVLEQACGGFPAVFVQSLLAR